MTAAVAPAALLVAAFVGLLSVDLLCDFRSDESLDWLFSVEVKKAVNPSEDPVPPLLSEPTPFAGGVGRLGSFGGGGEGNP